MAGKILAKGKGIGEMLAKSMDPRLNREDTILEVDDDTDLNSTWRIREK